MRVVREKKIKKIWIQGDFKYFLQNGKNCSKNICTLLKRKFQKYQYFNNQ